jgi:hypothetical protein
MVFDSSPNFVTVIKVKRDRACNRNGGKKMSIDGFV